MTVPPAQLEHKTASLDTPAVDAAAGGGLAYAGEQPSDWQARWQAKSPEFDLSGDPDGTAWAIVAVTGVRDDVGDVIVPGAFRRTLSERAMKGVLGHDWNRPVGVQRKAMELLPGDRRLPDTLADGTTPWPREAGALLVKVAYILDTSDGRDAWVQARAYDASQAYSIGYKVTADGARVRKGTRYITDLDVYEFSPVLHGANRLATLMAIKSTPHDLDGLCVGELIEAETRLAEWWDTESKMLDVGDDPDTDDDDDLDESPVIDEVDEDLDFDDQFDDDEDDGDDDVDFDDDEVKATVYDDPEYKGLRRVHNAAYWGMPVGTPIRPGMKPQRLRDRARRGRSKRRDAAQVLSRRRVSVSDAERFTPDEVREAAHRIGARGGRKNKARSRALQAHAIVRQHASNDPDARLVIDPRTGRDLVRGDDGKVRTPNEAAAAWRTEQGKRQREARRSVRRDARAASRDSAAYTRGMKRDERRAARTAARDDRDARREDRRTQRDDRREARSDRRESRTDARAARRDDRGRARDERAAERSRKRQESRERIRTIKAGDEAARAKAKREDEQREQGRKATTSRQDEAHGRVGNERAREVAGKLSRGDESITSYSNDELDAAARTLRESTADTDRETAERLSTYAARRREDGRGPDRRRPAAGRDEPAEPAGGAGQGDPTDLDDTSDLDSILADDDDEDTDGGAGQSRKRDSKRGSKSAPEGVATTDWVDLPEVKAIRKVIDAAYWGRPVGTIITPGMKPVGPRARAGGRDRGGAQRGVAGGMGTAGLGGIRRDTADGMRARRARTAGPDDYTAMRAGEARRAALDPERAGVDLDDADISDAALTRAENELRQELADRGDSPGAQYLRTAVERIDAEQARRAAAADVEVRDGERVSQARARVASTGDADTARSNIGATLARLDEQIAERRSNRERSDDLMNRRRNLAEFDRRDQAIVASEDGRVAAVHQGYQRWGKETRDLGWALVDTRTGDTVGENVDDDDVIEFAEGAADAITTREGRDGPAGGAGAAALREVPARGAGGDPAGTAGGVLPDAGRRGGAADRGQGGRAGGDGAAGGDVLRPDGAPDRGAAGGRGRGDAGADPAGSDGATVRDVDAGRGGDDAAGAGQRDGSGDGAGGRGGAVLDRSSGDGRDGDGGDAVADPAADAGLAADGVTDADTPPVDTQTARRLAEIPADAEQFRPGGVEDMAPAGARAKLDANMAALRTLRELQAAPAGTVATPEQQAVLARWAGWGGLPDVFDDRKPQFAAQRAELRGMLSDSEWNEALRNTLNAHYTDARVVESVWDAVRGLGFDGGRVLEPGSGSGTFIGFAPDGVDMVGVEKDSTTAAISKYLYPGASIRNESFGDTRVPDGSFDAAVGNVPFGKYQVNDPVHNADGKSIHNHFIVKSLALTRPGGIVAVLSSRFTMDSQDAKARREMAELGDLVGAVRLPTGSHQRTAGTDVIEDILIFRRRVEGEPPGDQSWVESSKVRLGGDGDAGGFRLPVNRYFQDHPENVLGEMTADKGRFGTGDMIVRGDRDFGGLGEALDRIVANARENGLTATPRGDAEPLPTLLAPDSGRLEGSVRREADGSFTQAVNGQSVPFTLPTSGAGKVDPEEMGGLLAIRDALQDLLAAESRSAEDTPEITDLRARLNAVYDGYVARYGAVNRYSYNKAGSRQNPAAPRNFRRDPSSAIVRALEKFDVDTGEVEKASVFRQRAAAPRQLATTADNPADALTLSLDTYGEIRLPEIARMLDVDEATARTRLGDLVHEVPPLSFEEEEAAVRLDRRRRLGETVDDDDVALGELAGVLSTARGQLEPAAAYLSGNVRRKLAVARVAAARDPRFAANVRALEAVLPAELGAEEVDARLGAVWIPESDVQAFANDLVRNGRYKVRNIGGMWTVEGDKHSAGATSEWGTDRRSFPELLEAVLNQQAIAVTTAKAPDPDATEAANSKATEIQERFSEWLWEDPDRARRLLLQYNDQFNGIALRNYDGAQRTFPGMAAKFRPRPHQVAAVERIVSEPTALLAHVVGAGKTAEMTMGTAELKRLGMARKPAIIIPNHMLEQFTREYLEVYPDAKILSAGTDDLADSGKGLPGDKRREFVARAATGEWDVVIMTQNAFESIPMRPESQREYIDRELTAMRAALLEARDAEGDKGDSVKKMEKSIASAEAAFEKLLSKGLKDQTGIYFEDTGIDYLMVDEAHHYSNLRTMSKIQSAGATGSGKASDLHMKLEWLRANSESGRVATFATGTPIRNTITQSYIMMRYLRPDLLSEAGINSFDQWAATFGDTVTEMELKPEGTGFRQTQRFAKFRNVPELLRIFHTFADVKMADDLNLETPNLVGGKASTVVVPGSDELADYITNLGARAKAVRDREVEPEDDNMLKISMDGRKAALSMSLVTDPETGEQLPHQVGKIEAAADRIDQIHQRNKDNTYLVDPKHPELGMSPNKGGLQIVFLDMGTPKSAADIRKAEQNGTPYYDAYDKLRQELVSRGMDPKRIRFMHEAKNDAQKAELFAAARDGRIDVLVGSTEKMGVGTNVQLRATALHHLDAPWRPADVEQRDGRILRQGNGNADVEIIRYVTEGSFDAYMWQTLERKAKFINQLMRGSLDVRELEDVGDTTMSYAEIKAAATGNPDLVHKAKIDALRQKLERQQRNHARAQVNAGRNIESGTRRVAFIDEQLTALDRIEPNIAPTAGDAFDEQIGDVDSPRYSNRAEAAEALGQYLSYHYTAMRMRMQSVRIGEVGGVVYEAVPVRDGGGVTIEIRAVGLGVVTSFDASKIAGSTATVSLPGLISRLENYSAAVPSMRRRLLEQRDRITADLEVLQDRVGGTFPKARELAAAQAKSARLQAKMERDARRAEIGMTRQDARDLAADLASGQDPGENVSRTRLAWDPRIDTDQYDDPILERDEPTQPIDVEPSDADVARAEGEREPRRPAPREVTSPTGQNDPAGDPATVTAGGGLDADTLDAARTDAGGALVDGDAGALSEALQRMGVPDGDSRDDLARQLITLPATEQERVLDQIEMVNAADDQQGTVLVHQQARELVDRPVQVSGDGEPGDDGADATISAAELAAAALDPGDGSDGADTRSVADAVTDSVGATDPDGPRLDPEGRATPGALFDAINLDPSKLPLGDDGELVPVTDPRPGDLVWAWGQGKMRGAVVVHVTRTGKVTYEFSTPTTAQREIERHARRRAEVAAAGGPDGYRREREQERAEVLARYGDAEDSPRAASFDRGTDSILAMAAVPPGEVHPGSVRRTEPASTVFAVSRVSTLERVGGQGDDAPPVLDNPDVTDQPRPSGGDVVYGSQRGYDMPTAQRMAEIRDDVIDSNPRTRGQVRARRRSSEQELWQTYTPDELRALADEQPDSRVGNRTAATLRREADMGDAAREAEATPDAPAVADQSDAAEPPERRRSGAIADFTDDELVAAIQERRDAIRQGSTGRRTPQQRRQVEKWRREMEAMERLQQQRRDNPDVTDIATMTMEQVQAERQYLRDNPGTPGGGVRRAALNDRLDELRGTAIEMPPVREPDASTGNALAEGTRSLQQLSDDELARTARLVGAGDIPVNAEINRRTAMREAGNPAPGLPDGVTQDRVNEVIRQFITPTGRLRGTVQDADAYSGDELRTAAGQLEQVNPSAARRRHADALRRFADTRDRERQRTDGGDAAVGGTPVGGESAGDERTRLAAGYWATRNVDGAQIREIRAENTAAMPAGGMLYRVRFTFGGESYTRYTAMINGHYAGSGADRDNVTEDAFRASRVSPEQFDPARPDADELPAELRRPAPDADTPAAPDELATSPEAIRAETDGLSLSQINDLSVASLNALMERVKAGTDLHADELAPLRARLETIGEISRQITNPPVTGDDNTDLLARLRAALYAADPNWDGRFNFGGPESLRARLRRYLPEETNTPDTYASLLDGALGAFMTETATRPDRYEQMARDLIERAGRERAAALAGRYRNVADLIESLGADRESRRYVHRGDGFSSSSGLTVAEHIRDYAATIDRAVAADTPDSPNVPDAAPRVDASAPAPLNGRLVVYGGQSWQVAGDDGDTVRLVPPAGVERAAVTAGRGDVQVYDTSTDRPLVVRISADAGGDVAQFTNDYIADGDSDDAYGALMDDDGRSLRVFDVPGFLGELDNAVGIQAGELRAGNDDREMRAVRRGRIRRLERVKARVLQDAEARRAVVPDYPRDEPTPDLTDGEAISLDELADAGIDAPAPITAADVDDLRIDPERPARAEQIAGPARITFTDDTAGRGARRAAAMLGLNPDDDGMDVADIGSLRQEAVDLTQQVSGVGVRDRNDAQRLVDAIDRSAQRGGDRPAPVTPEPAAVDVNELTDSGRRGSFGGPLLVTADGRFEVTTGRDAQTVLVTDRQFPRAGGASGTESYGSIVANMDAVPQMLADRRAGTDLESLLRPYGTVELRPSPAGAGWRSIVRVDSPERQTRRGREREVTTGFGFVDADGNVYTSPGSNGEQVGRDELPAYLAKMGERRPGTQGDRGREEALADVRAERGSGAEQDVPAPGPAEETIDAAEVAAALDAPAPDATPGEDALLTGNQYAGRAYQAFYLDGDPAAALAAIEQAARIDPEQSERWDRLRREYGGRSTVRPAAEPERQRDVGDDLDELAGLDLVDEPTAPDEPATPDVLDEPATPDADAPGDVTPRVLDAAEAGDRDELVAALIAAGVPSPEQRADYVLQSASAAFRPSGTPVQRAQRLLDQLDAGTLDEVEETAGDRGTTAARRALGGNAAEQDRLLNIATTGDGEQAGRRRRAMAEGIASGDELRSMLDDDAARYEAAADALDAAAPDGGYGEGADDWAPTLRAAAAVLRGDDDSTPTAPGGAPAAGAPADDPITLDRVDGPQAAILERRLSPDAGAELDGRALVVSDPDAFDGWINDEIERLDSGQGGQGRSQDRRDRRALVRLQTALEEERDDREERAAADTTEGVTEDVTEDVTPDTADGPDRRSTSDDEAAAGGSDGDDSQDGAAGRDAAEEVDEPIEFGDDEPEPTDRAADEGEPADRDAGDAEGEDEPTEEGPDLADLDGATADDPDSDGDAAAADDGTDDTPDGTPVEEEPGSAFDDTPADDSADDSAAPDGDAPAADEDEPAADEPTGPSEPTAGPDDTIAADALAEALAAEADALGIVEADDGEVEVTPEVAERQTRVAARLQEAAAGRLDVGALADSELREGRRDAVDELRLQEALQRREQQRRREARARQQTAPAAAAAPTVDADAGADAPAGDAPTPDPAAAPTPERRPGLAGAVEDLADAVEAGDSAGIAAGLQRARSSLARSRSDSDQHRELGALLDQLSAGEEVDAGRLRELATAIRDAAKARRNEQARNRRTARRLERERLRSLIGQYDAELRNRGQDPDEFGGRPPAPTPDDDGSSGDRSPPAGADGGDGPDGSETGDGDAAGAVDVDGGAGQGSGPDPVSTDPARDPAAVPDSAVPPTFDRADPDGPAGQARTTALVDGLVSQPWRLLASPSVLFAGMDAEQRRRHEEAARAAFADVLDRFGPVVRRRTNEMHDEAQRRSRARTRRNRDGAVTDAAAATFANLLTKEQTVEFFTAMQAAMKDYKRRVSGRRRGPAGQG